MDPGFLIIKILLKKRILFFKSFSQIFIFIDELDKIILRDRIFRDKLNCLLPSSFGRSYISKTIVAKSNIDK